MKLIYAIDVVEGNDRIEIRRGLDRKTAMTIVETFKEYFKASGKSIQIRQTKKPRPYPETR